MKNKFIYFLLVVVLTFSFTNNVFAEDVSQLAVKGMQDSLYNSLKTEFNKGIVNMNISQPNQLVVVYGHSLCSTSGCTYEYQGVNSSNLEDLLARAISCSDNSRTISYSLSSSIADDYKSSSYDYEADAYWSEVYSITCSNDGDVSLVEGSAGGGNTGNGDTGNVDAGSGNIGSGDTGNVDTGSGNYGSSTSGDDVNTGVETYYIILVVVAVMSYVIMKFIKKYNLFKSI